MPDLESEQLVSWTRAKSSDTRPRLRALHASRTPAEFRGALISLARGVQLPQASLTAATERADLERERWRARLADGALRAQLEQLEGEPAGATL